MHDTLVRLGRIVVSAGLLVGGVTSPAFAQQLVFGGGINGGSVPRSMAPLCAGARRLDGGGLSASAMLLVKRTGLHANLDHVAKIGGVSVAGCVPGTGIAVDSSFAPAGHSALTLSGAAWTPVTKQLDLGLETGWVLEHSSWYIGPALGGQHRHVRAEIIGRLHISSFDEVTRDFTSSPVREISRTKQSERSWGVAARILLVTRRR